MRQRQDHVVKKITWLTISERRPSMDFRLLNKFFGRSVQWCHKKWFSCNRIVESNGSFGLQNFLFKACRGKISSHFGKMTVCFINEKGKDNQPTSISGFFSMQIPEAQYLPTEANVIRKREGRSEIRESDILSCTTQWRPEKSLLEIADFICQFVADTVQQIGLNWLFRGAVSFGTHDGFVAILNFPSNCDITGPAGRRSTKECKRTSGSQTTLKNCSSAHSRFIVGHVQCRRGSLGQIGSKSQRGRQEKRKHIESKAKHFQGSDFGKSIIVSLPFFLIGNLLARRPPLSSCLYGLTTESASQPDVLRMSPQRSLNCLVTGHRSRPLCHTSRQILIVKLMVLIVQDNFNSNHSTMSQCCLDRNQFPNQKSRNNNFQIGDPQDLLGNNNFQIGGELQKSLCDIHTDRQTDRQTDK